MNASPPPVHPVPTFPLETARLVLRPPSPADALDVQSAVEESFDDLHRWMPWARQLQTLDQTKAFIERALAAAQAGEDFPLLGFRRDTGDFVLGTGIHPRNWEVPRFEIGYWCRSSMQRQGYTTEAVRGLTRLAFTALGAERIEIHCDSRNRPSRKVAERAGYRFEALLRAEDRSNDGSLRDTVIYALVRGDPASGPDLGESSTR